MRRLAQPRSSAPTSSASRSRTTSPGPGPGEKDAPKHRAAVPTERYAVVGGGGLGVRKESSCWANGKGTGRRHSNAMSGVLTANISGRCSTRSLGWSLTAIRLDQDSATIGPAAFAGVVPWNRVDVPAMDALDLDPRPTHVNSPQGTTARSACVTAQIDSHGFAPDWDRQPAWAWTLPGNRGRHWPGPDAAFAIGPPIPLPGPLNLGSA